MPKNLSGHYAQSAHQSLHFLFPRVGISFSHANPSETMSGERSAPWKTEIGVLILGGLPLLHFLANLSVEDILIE